MSVYTICELIFSLFFILNALYCTKEKKLIFYLSSEKIKVKIDDYYNFQLKVSIITALIMISIIAISVILNQDHFGYVFYIVLLFVSKDVIKSIGIKKEYLTRI